MARMAPQQRAQTYNRLPAAQRNQAMSRMAPQARAETISQLKPAQRAEAMYKMNPEQRSQTLARMSPQMRNSFEGKPSMSGGQKLAMGAAALGGGAIVANQMMRGQTNVPQREANASRNAGQENIQKNANSSSNSRSLVPRAPSFANPRMVDRSALGSKPQFSNRIAQPLAYRQGAVVPRAGNAKTGRAGALDPGGYTRQAASASPRITPSIAVKQFAQHIPNYAAQIAFNHQNVVANRANWPWQLPGYAPGWGNNGQGNWNWNQNWWQANNANNWWNWNNNGAGWGLSPWGLNSELGWIAALNYYNQYGWDGNNYPCSYFADEGYCPTPDVFDVEAGQFWQPGNGYSNYLPETNHAPITVAIKESVPTYNPQGQIMGYQIQNFYYNAFWDAQAQSYGYYDYRQQFHWLTFPWLNSWEQ